MKYRGNRDSGIVMKILLFSLISISTLTSCIENNIIPDTGKGSEDFLYVASFLETQRNYITSPLFPAILSAEAVNSNLTNYSIIDIREQSLYSGGHIPTSVNVQPSDLIDYLIESEFSTFSPIVIVSSTGQKSAYVTTLLRLFGYRNVYSLNFGLGYWNQKYSLNWTTAKGNSQNLIYHRNNYEVAKINSFSDFPASKFDDEDLPLDAKVEKRIRQLLSEQANEFDITVEEFEGYFDRKKRKYDRCKIIFYGEADIYHYVYNYQINISDIGFYTGLYSVSNFFTLRPKGSQRFDEKSINISSNLLSLPTNKLIFVYSVDGQESAAITAYLNVLGYEARTIRFGMYGMYSKYFYNSSISGTVKWANKDSKKENIDTVLTPTPVVEKIFNSLYVQDYSIELGN